MFSGARGSGMLFGRQLSHQTRRIDSAETRPRWTLWETVGRDTVVTASPFPFVLSASPDDQPRMSNLRLIVCARGPFHEAQRGRNAGFIC